MDKVPTANKFYISDHATFAREFIKRRELWDQSFLKKTAALRSLAKALRVDIHPRLLYSFCNRFKKSHEKKVRALLLASIKKKLPPELALKRANVPVWVREADAELQMLPKLIEQCRLLGELPPEDSGHVIWQSFVNELVDHCHALRRAPQDCDVAAVTGSLGLVGNNFELIKKVWERQKATTLYKYHCLSQAGDKPSDHVALTQLEWRIVDLMALYMNGFSDMCDGTVKESDFIVERRKKKCLDKKIGDWEPEVMQTALDKIISNEMTLREASIHFNISRNALHINTVKRRHGQEYFQNFKSSAQVKQLVKLYYLVKMHKVEEIDTEEQTRLRWAMVVRTYTRTAETSPSGIILQLRWHELKMLAQKHIQWRVKVKTHKVHPLLVEIATKYPHILNDSLSWREKVKTGKIYDVSNVPVQLEYSDVEEPDEKHNEQASDKNSDSDFDSDDDKPLVIAEKATSEATTSKTRTKSTELRMPDLDDDNDPNGTKQDATNVNNYNVVENFRNEELTKLDDELRSQLRSMIVDNTRVSKDKIVKTYSKINPVSHKVKFNILDSDLEKLENEIQEQYNALTNLNSNNDNSVVSKDNKEVHSKSQTKSKTTKSKGDEGRFILKNKPEVSNENETNESIVARSNDATKSKHYVPKTQSTVTGTNSLENKNPETETYQKINNVTNTEIKSALPDDKLLADGVIATVYSCKAPDGSELGHVVVPTPIAKDNVKITLKSKDGLINVNSTVVNDPETSNDDVVKEQDTLNTSKESDLDLLQKIDPTQAETVILFSDSDNEGDNSPKADETDDGDGKKVYNLNDVKKYLSNYSLDDILMKMDDISVKKEIIAKDTINRHSTTVICLSDSDEETTKAEKYDTDGGKRDITGNKDLNISINKGDSRAQDDNVVTTIPNVNNTLSVPNLSVPATTIKEISKQVPDSNEKVNEDTPVRAKVRKDDMSDQTTFPTSRKKRRKVADIKEESKLPTGLNLFRLQDKASKETLGVLVNVNNSIKTSELAVEISKKVEEYFNEPTGKNKPLNYNYEYYNMINNKLEIDKGNETNDDLKMLLNNSSTKPIGTRENGEKMEIAVKNDEEKDNEEINGDDSNQTSIDPKLIMDARVYLPKLDEVKSYKVNCRVNFSIDTRRISKLGYKILNYKRKSDDPVLVRNDIETENHVVKRMRTSSNPIIALYKPNVVPDYTKPVKLRKEHLIESVKKEMETQKVEGNKSNRIVHRIKFEIDDDSASDIDVLENNFDIGNEQNNVHIKTKNAKINDTINEYIDLPETPSEKNITTDVNDDSNHGSDTMELDDTVHNNTLLLNATNELGNSQNEKDDNDVNSDNINLKLLDYVNNLKVKSDNTETALDNINENKTHNKPTDNNTLDEVNSKGQLTASVKIELNKNNAIDEINATSEPPALVKIESNKNNKTVKKSTENYLIDEINATSQPPTLVKINVSKNDKTDKISTKNKVINATREPPALVKIESNKNNKTVKKSTENNVIDEINATSQPPTLVKIKVSKNDKTDKESAETYIIDEINTTSEPPALVKIDVNTNKTDIDNDKNVAENLSSDEDIDLKTLKKHKEIEKDSEANEIERRNVDDDNDDDSKPINNIAEMLKLCKPVKLCLERVKPPPPAAGPRRVELPLRRRAAPTAHVAPILTRPLAEGDEPLDPDLGSLLRELSMETASEWQRLEESVKTCKVKRPRLQEEKKDRPSHRRDLKEKKTITKPKTPDPDELRLQNQEWERQKTMNNRFFDLAPKYKRPVVDPPKEGKGTKDKPEIEVLPPKDIDEVEPNETELAIKSLILDLNNDTYKNNDVTNVETHDSYDVITIESFSKRAQEIEEKTASLPIPQIDDVESDELQPLFTKVEKKKIELVPIATKVELPKEPTKKVKAKSQKSQISSDGSKKDDAGKMQISAFQVVPSTSKGVSPKSLLKKPDCYYVSVDMGPTCESEPGTDKSNAATENAIFNEVTTRMVAIKDIRQATERVQSSMKKCIQQIEDKSDEPIETITLCDSDSDETNQPDSNAVIDTVKTKNANTPPIKVMDSTLLETGSKSVLKMMEIGPIHGGVLKKIDELLNEGNDSKCADGPQIENVMTLPSVIDLDESSDEVKNNQSEAQSKNFNISDLIDPKFSENPNESQEYEFTGPMPQITDVTSIRSSTDIDLASKKDPKKNFKPVVSAKQLNKLKPISSYKELDDSDCDELHIDENPANINEEEENMEIESELSSPIKPDSCKPKNTENRYVLVINNTSNNKNINLTENEGESSTTDLKPINSEDEFHDSDSDELYIDENATSFDQNVETESEFSSPIKSESSKPNVAEKVSPPPITNNTKTNNIKLTENVTTGSETVIVRNSEANIANQPSISSIKPDDEIRIQEKANDSNETNITDHTDIDKDLPPDTNNENINSEMHPKIDENNCTIKKDSNSENNINSNDVIAKNFVNNAENEPTEANNESPKVTEDDSIPSNDKTDTKQPKPVENDKPTDNETKRPFLKLVPIQNLLDSSKLPDYTKIDEPVEEKLENTETSDNSNSLQNESEVNLKDIKVRGEPIQFFCTTKSSDDNGPSLPMITNVVSLSSSSKSLQNNPNPEDFLNTESQITSDQPDSASKLNIQFILDNPTSPDESRLKSSDLSVKPPMLAADFVKNRDGTNICLVCIDESKSLWNVYEDYVILTNLKLPVDEPSYWTMGGKQQCTRLIMDASSEGSTVVGALSIPDEVFLDNHWYRKLSTEPMIYAKVWYVVPNQGVCMAMLNMSMKMHLYSIVTGTLTHMHVQRKPKVVRKSVGDEISDSGEVITLDSDDE